MGPLIKDEAVKHIMLERETLASASYEEALVLHRMRLDASDVLSVLVARTTFVAVVCWSAAVETQDAKRLV